MGKPYFTKQFEKCMLRDYVVAEFEDRWKKLVEEYGLKNNAWVVKLYEENDVSYCTYDREAFYWI